MSSWLRLLEQVTYNSFESHKREVLELGKAEVYLSRVSTYTAIRGAVNHSTLMISILHARQRIRHRYLSPCSAIHVTPYTDTEVGKVGRLITVAGGYGPGTRRD